ncbi:HNH endonuclease family protein, partial [Bifidobacterium adolescentis]
MKRLFKKYLIISVACSLPFFCGEPTAMAQENNALEAVSTLTVRQTDSVSGYDRDLFQWNKFDEDGDGCDTRNDILARDLDNISKQDKCVVLSGILDDPYTGDRIDFQRGQSTSSKVQIDHIVALSDAWNSGASHWNESKLRAFGNDPYNLAAVDGTANTQKSNSSADEWLPANAAARCLYVATQVGVKEHYALTVTQTEAQKMREVLGSCPTQSIPQSNGSGLVRLVEQNGKTKHGYPFVDQGNVDVDSEVREYRGMSSVIRQDMAAFLYRWAGSPEYTPSNADMHRFRDVDGATPH